MQSALAWLFREWLELCIWRCGGVLFLFGFSCCFHTDILSVDAFACHAHTRITEIHRSRLLDNTTLRLCPPLWLSLSCRPSRHENTELWSRTVGKHYETTRGILGDVQYTYLKIKMFTPEAVRRCSMEDIWGFLFLEMKNDTINILLFFTSESTEMEINALTKSISNLFLHSRVHTSLNSPCAWTILYITPLTCSFSDLKQL